MQQILNYVSPWGTVMEIKENKVDPLMIGYYTGSMWVLRLLNVVWSLHGIHLGNPIVSLTFHFCFENCLRGRINV